MSIPLLPPDTIRVVSFGMHLFGMSKFILLEPTIATVIIHRLLLSELLLHSLLFGKNNLSQS